MITYRVYRQVNYWIDVEVEDNETEMDAMDTAMNMDSDQWDSEVVNEGVEVLEDI